MSLLVLSRSERDELLQLVHATRSARLLRRAQALLALAEGTAVAEVARRVQVGASTVYDWARRYRGGTLREEALEDAYRSGRPPAERRRSGQILRMLMGQQPTHFGYRHTVSRRSALAAPPGGGA